MEHLSSQSTDDRQHRGRPSAERVHASKHSSGRGGTTDERERTEVAKKKPTPSSVFTFEFPPADLQAKLYQAGCYYQDKKSDSRYMLRLKNIEN